MPEERLKNSPANFTLYPLLWLAVCFMVGILSAKLLFLGWQFYLAACLIFAVLTVAFLNRKFALTFLSITFVAVGGLCFQIENQIVAANRLKKLYDKQQIKSGDAIEIEGVLQSKPELAVGGFFLELQTEKAIYKSSEMKVSGKIRLFAPVSGEQIAEGYEQLNLQYASRIRVACRLRREDNFLNAGVSSQKEILDQIEIDATGIIKSPLLVEKLGDEQTFAPFAHIFDCRENLIIGFRDNFNVSTVGVLIASLLGDKYFLDKPTAEVFREGSTFHVLVIYGLHITFIGGLVLLFIRFFSKKRFWQFLIPACFFGHIRSPSARMFRLCAPL